MNKIHRLLFSLTVLFLLGLPVAQAVAQQYVGSYAVSDGIPWPNNPPVYSAQEAAALVFGGNPSDYAISTDSNTTDPNTITRTGWYSGWGEGCAVYSEDYKLDVPPPGYNNPGGVNTARSAYVQDHCGFDGVGQRNYVWRIVPATTAAIPTLQEWALLLMGLLLGGLIWRQSQRNGRMSA